LTGRTQLKKGDTSNPFDSYLSSGGAIVSPETALKLSAVWACVQSYAETISTLPFLTGDSDKKIAKNHEVYRVLHDSPNADMCASEYWQIQSACGLYGAMLIVILLGGTIERSFLWSHYSPVKW
jgi:phage portal protein BeeE